MSRQHIWLSGQRPGRRTVSPHQSMQAFVVWSHGGSSVVALGPPCVRRDRTWRIITVCRRLSEKRNSDMDQLGEGERETVLGDRLTYHYPKGRSTGKWKPRDSREEGVTLWETCRLWICCYSCPLVESARRSVAIAMVVARADVWPRRELLTGESVRLTARFYRLSLTNG